MEDGVRDPAVVVDAVVVDAPAARVGDVRGLRAASGALLPAVVVVAPAARIGDVRDLRAPGSAFAKDRTTPHVGTGEKAR
jgi:hypothetical protein